MSDNPDAFFLALCQQLGAQAAAAGESPVGAVVVRAGEVVAAAAEATQSQGAITAHAELLALQAAREALGHPNLSECTLYSTHEPCVMCAYAIRYHRIRRVVYGQGSAYLGGASARGPVLSTAQVPPHWAPAPEVVEWPSS
ncbi:nucleoside deaminase [Hymenobacter taeanensis]|uniref:Nucleoside deaminase n=1 Tax=Hymenobacter taeanensis TaxID=2735321 RepID=A0A6M6BM81_9BACT|nr:MULTISPECIES: deaminase [Hymenobacter]QJX49070.1 nucleoside deaminase [Hymenobacter taeanensis]UOQ81409.1 deaminase [Hymenobacter sp. 5414T-23]